jgi:DNA polymerase-3 subunit epsilon
MDFDEKIVGAEFIRENISNRLFQTSRICTMKASTNFCKIPGPYGYKWPTLSELHFSLFHTEFEDTHNAIVDVEVCAKCFFQLKKVGIIK